MVQENERAKDELARAQVEELIRDKNEIYKAIREMEKSLSSIDQILSNIIERNQLQDNFSDILLENFNDLDKEVAKLSTTITNVAEGIGSVETRVRRDMKIDSFIEKVKTLEKSVQELEKDLEGFGGLQKELKDVKELVHKNEDFFIYDKRVITKEVTDSALKKYGIPAMIVGVVATAITAMYAFVKLMQDASLIK